MTLGHYICAATGVGYFVISMEQLYRGSIPNAILWAGYAFAQIGLWMNLKERLAELKKELAIKQREYALALRQYKKLRKEARCP
jgi:predicted nuclease with TOPRIM domain